MKEKTKPNFKRNLIISYIIGIAVLLIMAALLIWRDDWQFYDPVTYISDIFALGGTAYLLVWLFCMLSRTTAFSRFGYYAHKRSARKNKVMPQYRTLQEYMEKRPRANFDTRLFWIPAVTYFAIAVIFTVIAVL